ncbi:MAG: apolipoprotein N-acyltransferase, partial [Pyrinomonadaceae bacterium]
MKFASVSRIFPSWENVLLAILAAALLILSFPDFEYWFLAWFALAPLMWAVEREKASTTRSFVLGWIFGTIFFFSTCWWLTFAPITYAGFPPVLAYFLLFMVTAITGVFPGIFAGILSIFLRRFGSMAFLAAPFVWVFTEFLRYWVTGNNWNAIGYSQAFGLSSILEMSGFGGMYLSGFGVVIVTAFLTFLIVGKNNRSQRYVIGSLSLVILSGHWLLDPDSTQSSSLSEFGTKIIAIQANVPMAGLDSQKWNQLRQRQIDLAEAEIRQLTTDNRQPTTVILPESPMNFMYNDDREFQQFIGDFARRNNVSVLFNSAEPDATNGKYFNSAVMVGPDGREAAQYDKIYLLPFGEAVPSFLEGIVPGFVGNFSYGGEYDILPLGDAKAGVMICFESHFGQLSRQYVRNGADVLIEMTNDGYLGPTPILRQHLANAVFRAVET